ncbi:hypothetical protein AMECASPLE_039567 [Ameca splendens]|uniref:Uncharacterized protein n=1 Tax=Ameca splendens TaxID=208324 RepID=A0ABV0Z839_9TELE
MSEPSASQAESQLHLLPRSFFTTSANSAMVFRLCLLHRGYGVWIKEILKVFLPQSNNILSPGPRPSKAYTIYWLDLKAVLENCAPHSDGKQGLNSFPELP